MSQDLPLGDRVCRICLQTVPMSQPATYLFDTDQGFLGLRNIAEAIVLLCEVQLLPDEHSMPQWCCGPCSVSLRAAFQLRALCQESDRQLRGLSTAVKLEEEDEEDQEPVESAMFCMEVEMIQEDPLDQAQDALSRKDETDGDVSQPPWKLPKRKHKYSEQDLQYVVEQIRLKRLTLNKASREYKIPRATIQHRLANANKPHVNRKGPGPTFTEEEEASVVRWLQDMQRKGFAITRASIQQKMFDLLEESPRKNLFRQNRPGKSWLEGFVNRHPELHLSGPFPNPGSVTESYIRNWFNSVSGYFSQENLLDVISDSSRVLLAHATYFLRKSDKSSTVDLASHVSNISVMSCVSADGLTYRPSVVLSHVPLPKALRQTFARWCAIEAQEHGLLTGPFFLQWIRRFVYEPLVKRKIKLPVIVFIECGTKNAVAFNAAEQCLKMGLVLVAVFPGASRFWNNRLRENWIKCADEHRKRNESITIEKFAQVLEAAMDRSNDGATIQKDFRSAGLFPFDASAFDYSLCPKKEDSGGGETSAQSQPSQSSVWDPLVLCT